MGKDYMYKDRIDMKDYLKIIFSMEQECNIIRYMNLKDNLQMDRKFEVDFD